MSGIEPPATQDAYVVWASENIGSTFDDATKRNYESNSAVALLAVQQHDFFDGLSEFLRGQQEVYRAKKNSDLFMGEVDVTLVQKSYESAVNKSFRHNVIWNYSWPGEPEGGWVTHKNWFAVLKDIIRGTVVCKYIDGPRHLAERLEERANSLGLSSYYSSKQRDEGYYAYHFYVKIPVELSDMRWKPTSVDLEVELQLTTQLQEVLYNITHRYYEHNRSHRSADPSAWKWEVSSPRFRAGYLGHTLHLLEAIILELREVGPAEDNSVASEDDNGQH